MTSKKISALTASSALSGTEEFPDNDGGTNFRVSANQIKDYVYSVPVITADFFQDDNWIWVDEEYGFKCTTLSGDFPTSDNKLLVFKTNPAGGFNNSYLSIKSVRSANHVPVELGAQNDQGHHTPIGFVPLNDNVRHLFTQDTPGAGGDFPAHELWNTPPTAGNTAYGSAEYSCYLQNAPVADQFVGGLASYARTAGGFKTTYSLIRTYVVDPDTAEAGGVRRGEMRLSVKVAGSNPVVAKLSNGMCVGTPTGSYQGLGSINAEAAYVNGAVVATLSVENQPLTGGVTVTEKDLGTVSSGTTTLDMGDRPMHKYTNNGAHTLAPGTTIGSTLIAITNGASAGAITTSGWTKVAGDSFTTTNGHKFMCAASVSAVGSLLTIQAMQ